MSEEVLDLCLDHEPEDWLKEDGGIATIDKSPTAEVPQGNLELEEAVEALPAAPTPTPSVASSKNSARRGRSSSRLQEDVTKIGSPAGSVTSSTATTRTGRSLSVKSDSGSGSLFSATTTPGSKKKKGKKGRTKQTKVKLLEDAPSNDEVYIVEAIVGKKMIFTEDGKKKLHYFIKWKGWATAHNTWEPLENLGGCLDLVNAYEEDRTERRNKGLDSDPDADGDHGLTESEHSDKTRKELVECGVEPDWPTELIPLNVEGVVNIDKHLCYIVRHQAKKYVEALSAENTVIVRAETFRRAFPHIVITYYENCILWVDRSETKEEMELKSKTAVEVSKLVDCPGNLVKKELEEDEELDEDGLPLPKIAIKSSADLFGLPLPQGDSSSSSDDDFEEKPIPNPVLVQRNQ